MSPPTVDGVDGRSMKLTARTASTESKVEVKWVIENFEFLVDAMMANVAAEEAERKWGEVFDDHEIILTQHHFPIHIDIESDHVETFQAFVILSKDFEKVAVHMQLNNKRCKSSKWLARIEATVYKENGEIAACSIDPYMQNFFGSRGCHGWPCFIPMAGLDNCLDSKGALNLTLSVVYFVPPFRKKSSTSVFKNTKHFNNCLSALRDPEYADFEIRVTDGTGKTFKCHKFVLSAQSPVFRAMFRSESIESRTGVVEIPDVTAGQMELFLEWIYCGRFSGDLDDLSGPPAWVESLPKLLEVADKYCVYDLVGFCDEHLIRAVTKKNALDLIGWANRLCLKKANEDITNYIAANAKDIFSIESNEEKAESGSSDAGASVNIQSTDGAAGDAGNAFYAKNNYNSNACVLQQF